MGLLQVAGISGESIAEVPAHSVKKVAGECAIVVFEAAADTFVDMGSDGLGWMFEKLFPNSKGNKYLNQFTTNMRFGFSSRANLMMMSNANKFMEEKIRKPIEDDIKTKKVRIDDFVGSASTQSEYLERVKTDLREKYPSFSDKQINQLSMQSLAYSNKYSRDKKQQLDNEGSKAIKRYSDSQNTAMKEVNTYSNGTGICKTGYDVGSIAEKDTSMVKFESEGINKLLNGTGYFDR